MPEVHWKVANYLAKIADAMETLGSCESGHGEYYVSKVVIGYDGEDTSYSVGPDEFGGYAVRVD